MLVQLSTPDNAQGAPVVPFTVPEQTAVELVFRAVLPPLSNGLGPRWARVLAYSPGKTPAQGVNVTLLMYNSQTPLSEFLTVSHCSRRPLCDTTSRIRVWQPATVEHERCREARTAASNCCDEQQTGTDRASVLLTHRFCLGQQLLVMLGCHNDFSSLQLVDGALSELSGLLALAGLPVTLTPQYARPVAGFTLEVGPAAPACPTYSSLPCCLSLRSSLVCIHHGQGISNYRLVKVLQSVLSAQCRHSCVTRWGCQRLSTQCLRRRALHQRCRQAVAAAVAAAAAASLAPWSAASWRVSWWLLASSLLCWVRVFYTDHPLTRGRAPASVAACVVSYGQQVRH